MEVRGEGQKLQKLLAAATLKRFTQGVNLGRDAGLESFGLGLDVLGGLCFLLLGALAAGNVGHLIRSDARFLRGGGFGSGRLPFPDALNLPCLVNCCQVSCTASPPT